MTSFQGWIVWLLDKLTGRETTPSEISLGATRPSSSGGAGVAGNVSASASAIYVASIKTSNLKSVVAGIITALILALLTWYVGVPFALRVIANALPDPYWANAAWVFKFMGAIPIGLWAFLSYTKTVPLRHLATMSFLGRRIQTLPLMGRLIFGEGLVWVPPGFELQSYSQEQLIIRSEVGVPSKDMADLTIAGAVQVRVNDPLLWANVDVIRGAEAAIKNRFESMLRKAAALFNLTDINDMKGVFEEILRGKWYLIARHASEQDAPALKGTLIRNKANSPIVRPIDAAVATDKTRLAMSVADFRTELETLSANKQIEGYHENDSVELIPSPDLNAEGLSELIQRAGAELLTVDVLDITYPKDVLEATAKAVKEVFEAKAMRIENAARIERINELVKLWDGQLTADMAWDRLLAEDNKIKAVALFGNYQQFEKIFNSLGTTISQAIKAGAGAHG